MDWVLLIGIVVVVLAGISLLAYLRRVAAATERIADAPGEAEHIDRVGGRTPPLTRTAHRAPGRSTRKAVPGPHRAASRQGARGRRGPSGRPATASNVFWKSLKLGEAI